MTKVELDANTVSISCRTNYTYYDTWTVATVGGQTRDVSSFRRFSICVCVCVDQSPEVILFDLKSYLELLWKSEKFK